MSKIANWESKDRPEGPWAIMFHHFHSVADLANPGSINGEQFRSMLQRVQETHKIVGPDDFLNLIRNGEKSSEFVLLTFDDALLSQIQIALPILNEFSLSALFNVYSSVWTNSPPSLEIWASFRRDAFESFDLFYEAFISEINSCGFGPAIDLLQGYPTDYLSTFTFYSENERRFRFLRDIRLGADAYSQVMNQMLTKNGYSPEQLSRDIWFTESDCASILSNGSQVGLHSFSHPTTISSLSLDKQTEEYTKNFDDILRVTGVAPRFVAHPCGDYSPETLSILAELGIEVGFRSSPSKGEGSNLEIPREDHSILANRMGLQ